MKEYSELHKEVLRCNRCGTCQHVCPTYQVSSQEFAVARGRVYLLRRALEGTYALEGNRNLRHHLESCLMCSACQEVCPPKVKVDRLVQRVKGISRKKEFHLYYLFYPGIFSSQRKLVLLHRMLSLYDGWGVKKFLETSNLTKMMGNWGERLVSLPKVKEVSAHEALHRLTLSPQNPKGKVGYFLGCAYNYFYPDVAVSSVRLLLHSGFEVAMFASGCCGAPHLAAGLEEEARRLAEQNVELVRQSGIQVLIVDCASCGSSLRSYGELLGKEPPWKVEEITSFLLETAFPGGITKEKLVLAYHDPCHQNRGMGIKEQPRTFLKSWGHTLVEMPESEMCCGGGGIYGILHPEFSRRIISRKVDNFLATKATALVTSCPACMMQWQYGFKLRGLHFPVLHPVQLARGEG